MIMVPVFLLAVVFTAKPFGNANQEVPVYSPGGFSAPYGLLVHNANAKNEVSRLKALEVLLNFFGVSEVSNEPKLEIEFTDLNPDSNAYSFVYKACQLKVVNCSDDQFNPKEKVSQQDFLLWFFRLHHISGENANFVGLNNIPETYFQAWLQARQLNISFNGDLNLGKFQDFLYKYQISKAHQFYPYQFGMVLDLNEINRNRLNDLRQIEQLKKGLIQVLNDVSIETNESVADRLFITRINNTLEKYSHLEEDLMRNPYLLSKRKDFPAEVQNAVREYGLREVLYEYSYEYGHNAPYRQHNLITGVKKLHGKIFRPGEVIDYWNLISDNNLTDFKYGWVIAGGEERWAFGGGICGSSTMLYTPMWKSGFEILERRNHTKFYSNLYPVEDIGLDATVYRPRPNLRIRNNFDDPIVFNVIDDTEAEKITLEIIGNPKYQNIEIEGPIYKTKTHIQWIRRMTDYNGEVTTEYVDSRYNKIYK